MNQNSNYVNESMIAVAIVIIVVAFFSILPASSQDHLSDPADTRKVESVIINVDANKIAIMGERVADVVPEIATAQQVIAQETENAPNCVSNQTQVGEIVFVWCDDGTEKGRVDMELVDNVLALSVDEYIVPSTSRSGGSYVVSKLYSCSYYNCSQFTQTTSYSSMCNGAEFWLPNLAGYGWANVASSGLSFGNCGRLDLFANGNYGGANVACTQACPSLGSLGFDNNAESTKTK